MRRPALACCLALAALAMPGEAGACTTFLAEHGGQLIYGKNYDWNEDVGLVVVNPRGLYKTSFLLLSKDVPATWKATYGSLTFNQYGVEFPIGGVNEKGLVIENMILESSVYPPNNGAPTVNELQWIQYGLDRFATVAELAEAAPAIRVSPASAKLHYLACDATGDCAAFEYIAGQLVISRGAAMPTRTLANDTYPDSCAYLATVQSAPAVPTSPDSLDRFARAALATTQSEGTTVPASAFAILDNVAQGMTVWSQVYALKDGVVYFRTKKNRTIKSIAYGSLDYGTCARKILDIHTTASGDVSALLTEYTATANAALVKQAMSSLFSRFSDTVIAQQIAYPDACTCTEPPDAGAPDTRPVAKDAAAPVVTPPEKKSGCAFAPHGTDGSPLRLAPLALMALLTLATGRARHRRR